MSTTGIEIGVHTHENKDIPENSWLSLRDIEPTIEQKEKRRAVLIYSGGLDSTTLLYKLISDGFDVYPLTINYGQKHIKELECAKNFCKIFYLGHKHKVIDISDIGKIIDSSLTSADKDVPQAYNLNKTEPRYYNTLKSTVVPFRNAIFISIAVGYAESIGANYVFYAAHYSDRGMYPDCRSEFVNEMTNAARQGTGNPNIKIVAPFVNFTKSNIVEVGEQVGVPYHLTWSCYVGGNKHCGKCSSCTERKIAFKDAKVNDPTEYEY